MLGEWPPGLFNYWLAFYRAEAASGEEKEETETKPDANRIDREQAMLASMFGKK